jgi:hypothetical protein
VGTGRKAQENLAKHFGIDVFSKKTSFEELGVAPIIKSPNVTDFGTRRKSVQTILS